MSSTTHHKPHKQDSHGSTGSYVVGFILSLIFTFIPYHLVVNKVMTGDALIITILGIAVVQMAIQLLFFLHLGRGPKPLYNIVFFFATAGVIVLTVGASLFIMSNLYHNMSPQEVTTRIAQEENIAQVNGEDTGACLTSKVSHLVIIKNGKVSPMYTDAKRCDTLTFVNEDDKRIIVFGIHPDYESYGGVFEVPVSKGDPETITLNQSGDFIFHDHIDHYVVGYFSVSP